MMHGREKSDSAIVAGKPTNKAVSTAAEPVERRAEAKGNAKPAKHAPDSGPGKCVTGAGSHTASSNEKRFAVTHPRWEPYARIGPVRICAGGAQ